MTGAPDVGKGESAAALKATIEAAGGRRPVDLLLRGGRLVNVASCEVHEADVAVADGLVVGIGLPGEAPYEAREMVDCTGKWVAPGLLDGHMHVESTLVTPREFARAVVPRGTVGVVLDPHEIANVHGIEGIRWILDSRLGLPLRAFVMLSSCVPATHMETSGAELGAADLAPLFDEEDVPGLAEVMNFPGVVHGDPGILEKLAAARAGGSVIDGHCPGLRGRELSAYIAAGPGSDHESTSLEEAREKLRKGMRVMIREASTARNLEALLPLVTPASVSRFCLVTDDRHPDDLLEEGHVDHAVRKAIGLGLDPVLAWRMASLSTAEWFRLDRRGIGAVAPGYRADLLVLGDLERVAVERVYVDGALVARDGELLAALPPAPRPLPPSVRVDLGAFPGFRIPAEGSHVRVIEVVPGQIVTGAGEEEARIRDGAAVADPDRDLLEIAVVERHGRGGGVGLGFVRGFGLREGAIGSSVAHDNHNLVIAGADDACMRRALEELVAMQGGFVVVAPGEGRDSGAGGQGVGAVGGEASAVGGEASAVGGEASADGGTTRADGPAGAGGRPRVTARLPLPIAGLMSDRPLEEVRDGLDALHAAYRALGGGLESPFMALSFLALAVIPSLKITDRGLVDVERFELVDVWRDPSAPRPARRGP